MGQRLTKYQSMWLSSRVNGGEYRGDDLPCFKWKWPRGTWMQKKLEALSMLTTNKKTAGENLKSVTNSERKSL